MLISLSWTEPSPISSSFKNSQHVLSHMINHSNIFIVSYWGTTLSHNSLILQYAKSKLYNDDWSSFQHSFLSNVNQSVKISQKSTHFVTLYFSIFAATDQSHAGTLFYAGLQKVPSSAPCWYSCQHGPISQDAVAFRPFICQANSFNKHEARPVLLAQEIYDVILGNISCTRY